MKRRILAVLLALCLFAGFLPAASAATPTLTSSVNLGQLVEHGISLFKALEAGGKWDSVTNTSQGCVGMGIMGWIGSAACQLLKWCGTSSKGGDPDYCRAVLGDDLFNEIMSIPVPSCNSDDLMPAWSGSGSWRYRKFTSEELAAAKTLLGSAVGIRVQKNLANLYLTRQAQHGWDAGVRTEAGLLYYCSAENHYGEGGVKSFMTAVRNALGISSTATIDSLNMFHSGVVAAANAGTVSTLAYRTKVYNYLVNTLHLDPGPDTGSNPTPTPDPDPDDLPFTDVPEEGYWAYDAIVWAYTSEPQVTSGTSATTFSPDKTVTRAEAVTFLWAAAGKPAPKTSTNPFSDVSSDKYYYKAVLWAVEKGITSGTTATTFSPSDPVTRAQMITFIWRFAGSPSPGRNTNPFSDVADGKYYWTACVWAYWGGILVGNETNSASLLDPNTACSRAYVVTYLYNQFIMTAH